MQEKLLFFTPLIFQTVPTCESTVGNWTDYQMKENSEINQNDSPCEQMKNTRGGKSRKHPSTRTFKWISAIFVFILTFHTYALANRESPAHRFRPVKMGTTGCCYLLQPHLSAVTVIRQVFLYIRIMSGVTAILSPEPRLPTQAIVLKKRSGCEKNT